MPIATIETPEGRIVRIEVPEGATQAQIISFVQSQDLSSVQPPAPAISQDIPTAADVSPSQLPQEPQGLTAGEIGSGALNLAGAGLAGVGEEIATGLSGLGGLLMGKPLDASLAAAEGLGEQIPDFQLSPEGEALAGAISEKFQAQPEMIKEIISDFVNLGKDLGERTFEATGSPLAATAVRVLPEALEAVSGIRGGKAVVESAASRLPATVESIAQDVAKPQVEFGADAGLIERIGASPSVVDTAVAQLQKLSPKKQELKQSILARSGDVDTAGKTVTPAGAVVDDPLQLTAKKQGFDEGDLAAITAGTRADKDALLEQLIIRKEGKTNRLKEFQNRPSAKAGQNLIKRFDVVKEANRKSGKEIGIAAEGLKGKQVDFSPAVDSFQDSLESLGVKFDGDTLELDFVGSDIEGITGAETAINRIVKRMSTGEAPEAFDLHRLKKFIDNQVTFGKTTAGLTPDADRLLKGLRSDIDGILDDNFPAYKKANDTYSETIGALDNFQSVMGKKVDLTGKRAANKVGRELRKVMSNFSKSDDLMDVIEEIEEVAVKNGGKFDDDILLQSMFAKILDERFGPSGRGTFAGEIGTEIKRGAGRILRGDVIGAAGDVVTGTTNKLKSMGVSDRKAFDAMEELLRESN